MSYDFEKHILNGIPLEEAASFFVRIRGTTKEASLGELEEAYEQLSPEEQLAVFKTASDTGFLEKLHPGTEGYHSARMLAALNNLPAKCYYPDEKYANAPTAPGALPATAMGQNMQPPTPAALPPTAMGQQQMKAAANKAYEVGKERGDAAISARDEKFRHSGGERVGKHTGTVGGALAGAAAGHKAGHGHPAGTATGAVIGALVGRGVGADLGHSVDSHRFAKKMKEAAAKLGFDSPMSPEGEVGNQPDIYQYLASEQQGQQIEDTNANNYYQQKFQQAMQQLEQVQGQAQEAQTMADSLQQQVSGSQEQIQSSMQQAQIAQQAAMQNVQQAHDMAMGATQQAMEAQGEVLRQKQLAAAMRMGVLQVKDQVMSALAQDPTEALASQLTSPPPGSMPGGAPGVQQDPGQQGMQNASTQAAANPDPSQQPQQGGGGPGSPGQEAGAQGQPNSAGAGESGEAVSDANSGKSSGPGSSSSAKGTTRVEIKQAFSIPHALGGAVIGAGVGGAYSQMSNDPLRDKVKHLSASEGRSFSQAMDLAQAKARLAMGEAATEHPMGTALMGALQGGIIGGTQGPGAVDALRGIGQNVKGTYQSLRQG